MQSIGHANSPTSEGNVEVLGSLSLDGTSGKVLAVLDEHRLSFESKTGHLTSIKLSSILHTHHHNSRLAPFWVAFLGVIFVWFGFRIIDPLNFRIGAMIIGGVFISSWILTGRPTLTIETDDNVCFAVMGNDAKLMRMNHLVQRISQGMSMQEARDGLELLERDTDYPGVTILEESFDLIEPVNIETPTSIGTFLGSNVEESPMAMFDSAMFSSDEEQVLELEYAEEVQAETELPDWYTNEEPEMDLGLFPSFSADGLIDRANENIETRRYNEQPPQQYGAAQPNPVYNQNIPPQMPYHQQFGNQQYQNNNQFVHPQMHQMPANVQQPGYNQNATPPPMPMHQPMGMAIPSDAPLIPSPNYSESLVKQEAGESQLPEPLPNFWNSDGAHVPSVNQAHESTNPIATFNAPDSLPNSLTGNSVNSIVASARSKVEATPSSPNGLDGPSQTMGEKYRHLKKRDNGIQNHSRLILKSRTPFRQSRGGVVGGLVRSSLSLGARHATRVAQSATRVATTASRTILGREAGYDISDSTESLRSRSHQNLVEEVSSSIQNLSEKAGGNLPQHEVDRLHQHIGRTNSLIEQQAQNELESISFGDLVDSETHTSSTAGKGGLPRLDL